MGTSGAVLHVFTAAPSDGSRFGFIVAKTVGNAVTRNLVRRRLRSICRDMVPAVPAGTDVVIRALPGCDAIAWATLHSEITEGVERAVSTG